MPKFIVIMLSHANQVENGYTVNQIEDVLELYLLKNKGEKITFEELIDDFPQSGNMEVDGGKMIWTCDIEVF